MLVSHHLDLQSMRWGHLQLLHSLIFWPHLPSSLPRRYVLKFLSHLIQFLNLNFVEVVVHLGWQATMDREMQSTYDHHTWDLVSSFGVGELESSSPQAVLDVVVHPQVFLSWTYTDMLL